LLVELDAFGKFQRGFRMELVPHEASSCSMRR
jgi:hypothetical protein